MAILKIVVVLAMVSLAKAAASADLFDDYLQGFINPNTAQDAGQGASLVSPVSDIYQDLKDKVKPLVSGVTNLFTEDPTSGVTGVLQDETNTANSGVQDDLPSYNDETGNNYVSK